MFTKGCVEYEDILHAVRWENVWTSDIIDF